MVCVQNLTRQWAYPGGAAVESNACLVYERLLVPLTSQERAREAPREITTDTRDVHGLIIAALRSD